MLLTFEGKNVGLRAIEPSDLELIYLWENDPENWFISNTSTPFSRHTLRKYIENAHADIHETRQLRLMIDLLSKGERTGKTIGTVDIFDFEPVHRRAGIGILIARKEERMKGYASEALGILINYAFQTLHLHQVYCNVAEGNLASIRLFEKSGFRIAGKKKDWMRNHPGWTDVYFMQLLAGN